MKPYYEHAGITIYHGDALSVLPLLDRAELILTDPPYGVTRNWWDSTNWILTWPELMQQINPAAIVMTAQQPFTSKIVSAMPDWFKWADVWHKTQARGRLNAKFMPLREHEDILVFSRDTVPFYPQLKRKLKENVRPNSPRTKGSDNYGPHGLISERSIADNMSYPRSVVRFANSQEGDHPTQKPVQLFTYLILSYSRAAELVIDPFCGSGTTLAAAKRTGRRAIGIEIEERYCEIAAKRLSQEVMQFQELGSPEFSGSHAGIASSPAPKGDTRP